MEKEIEKSPFGDLRATVRYRKDLFAGDTISEKRNSAYWHLKSLAEAECEGQPVWGIIHHKTFYSEEEIEQMIREEIKEVE
jgi:hypothetical protein